MTTLSTLHRNAARQQRPILLAARISAILSTRRQRAQLARLDTAALDDIGLSHSQAQSEANRRLWDVPDTWRN